MTKTEVTSLLSERFEVSFNLIHDSLKNIVKIKDDRFTVLLRVGGEKHPIIKTYKDDLEQYAKLRNALVHEKVEIGYYIAEPNIKVVEHIEKIAYILSKPNYALSIATKAVISFDLKDSVLQLIDAIRDYGYSRYPIYLDRNAIGLLSGGDILKWMTTNGVNNLKDLENIKISEVFRADTHNPLMFVPKNMNIFEVEDLFENAHKSKSNMSAVIITENGRYDEIPLGIITAWDLIEIDYTADL